jgi:thioredoxin 1
MIVGPINVTDQAFERVVVKAERPVVAAFWSRQDERADDLRDVLEATAEAYGDEIRVARVEAGDAPQAHARYERSSTPQLLFFRDGKLVARARGVPTQEALRPWTEYLLGRGPAPARRKPKPTSGAATGRPVTVSDADFNQVVLQADKPVLVDFWAAWCAPCRTLAPVIDRLAAEFAGQAVVAKLDVEANPATAQQYGAMSIPTLIFFKNGQEVNRVVGAQPEPVLRSHLQALV